MSETGCLLGLKREGLFKHTCKKHLELQMTSYSRVVDKGIWIQNEQSQDRIKIKEESFKWKSRTQLLGMQDIFLSFNNYNVGSLSYILLAGY